MPKYDDLTNMKFGKLLVLRMTRLEHRTGIYWICKCDCGNTTQIRTSSLKRGRSKSCGCSINQSEILKFKKKNPNASYTDIVLERIRAHTKWVNGCLEWTACVSIHGYGLFVYDKKTINASRAIWIAKRGPIPDGLCVLHHCDNRKCVNLKHLYLGSHETNTYDMVRKGRDNWETCRKFPVGTREKAYELFTNGMTSKEVAKELGITQSQVRSLIQNHRNKLKNLSLNISKHL